MFRPRSWKLVAAVRGNEFHHGFGCEVSSKRSEGSCQQGNKMRKEIWRARVEKTFAHKAHTALGKRHPLLGILISCRWSFLAWDHPAKPETFIPLPHPHHPVQTQAWVVLLVR